MKKYLFWLKTEYKRAAVLLPKILLKAVMLALSVGMIAFCGQKIANRDSEHALVQIGYTAADDRLTGLAVSFVENMESVKNFCRLLPMTEEEGLNKLQKGEISALLVLPENVIEEILYGSNAPAKLYVADNDSPFGMLFAELGKAGVGMLQTAQAEIYATGMLAEKFSCGYYRLTQMYEEIDAFNLEIVLNREQYFKSRSLSKTGSQSIAVYYGSAIFTMYLLLSGLFFGSYLARSRTEQQMLFKRLRILPVGQAVGRLFVTVDMLCFLLLLPACAFFLPVVRSLLKVSLSGGGLLLLLSAVCFAAVWLQVLYLLAENHRTAMLSVGVSTLIMGYFSGCFVPSPLMPQIAVKISAFLPTTYVKAAFTLLFAGQGSVKTPLLCLTGYTGVLLLISILLINRKSTGRQLRSLKKGSRWARNRTDIGLDSLRILTKRLLLKKSFVLCLLLTVLVSVVAVQAEKQSQTKVYAAVYTEDGELGEVLSAYDGLIKFLLFDTEEELKRSVLTGKTECGYILQEDLQKQIMQGRGSWAVTVYESADSTLTKLVNEVLFERIFYVISSKLYEGYIAENEDFQTVKEEIGEKELRKAAINALKEKRTDGSTFTFSLFKEENAEESGGNSEQKAQFPVWAVALAEVFFCGIIGVPDACEDTHKGRFRRKSAGRMAFLTIVLPIAGGTAVGMITLALSGASRAVMKETVVILSAAVLMIIADMIIWKLFQKK